MVIPKDMIQAGRRYTARQGRRIFPLKFVNVEFEALLKAEVCMQCKQFHSEEVQKIVMQTTRTDITFLVEQLQKCFNGDSKSLTNNMNEKLLEGEKVGNATKADPIYYFVSNEKIVVLKNPSFLVKS